jgi:hypothetical protein
MSAIRRTRGQCILAPTKPDARRYDRIAGGFLLSVNEAKMPSTILVAQVLATHLRGEPQLLRKMGRVV